MARPGHCSWLLAAAVERCLEATSPLSCSSLFEGWGEHSARPLCLPGQYVYFPCIYSANIFLVHLVCPAPCLALDEAHTF